MKKRNLKARIAQLEAENAALREKLAMTTPLQPQPYPMTTETWPPPLYNGPARTSDGWILDYAPITLC